MKTFEQPESAELIPTNKLTAAIQSWEQSNNKAMTGDLVDYVKELPPEKADYFCLEVLNDKGINIGAIQGRYVDSDKATEIINLCERMFDPKEAKTKDERATEIAELIEG